MGLFDDWHIEIPEIKLPKLTDVANVAVNFGTFGLAGVNENGGIDMHHGYLSHGADEFVGELSGRNMARDQMAESRARIAAEQVQREQDRANQLKDDEARDRSASSAALAVRNTGAARSASRLNFNSLGANPFEKDFLGL